MNSTTNYQKLFLWYIPGIILGIAAGIIPGLAVGVGIALLFGIL
jgi:TctA family transporter